MESTFQLQQDGQAVLQEDFNQFGETAGLSDDRLYAEILRMVPNTGTVAKGVLPYGYAGATNPALVVANGASGSVLVNPFRAFVGTRVLEATEAKENWRDIRSGLSLADGDTSLTQTIGLAANASGFSRWDAIYAIVAIDADSASVIRKVKSPLDGVVTDTSVSVTRQTEVTVDVATGTPLATPVYPSIPSDSSDTFYILLAYVRVPTGFTAGSTVAVTDINEAATVLTLDRAMGASAIRPANQHNVAGGTAISGTGTSTGNGVLKWTGTSASRPGLYMPPTMTGGEQIIVLVDLGNASSANWSHQTGAVIDNSVDWRNRFFKWTAQLADTDKPVPWKQTGTSSPLPCASTIASGPGVDASGFCTQIGLGQSFMCDDSLHAGHARVATFVSESNIPNTVMVAGTIIDFYVNLSTGALHVAITGVPLCSVFLWIEATGPYGNAS